VAERWTVPAFGVDQLRLAPAEGTPDPPGPGQVRVELRAWSLNYRDLLMVRGQYDPRLALPFVPLSDAVGTVAAVGDGVTRVEPGDRVCATFAPSWVDGDPDYDAVRRTRGGPIPGVAARWVTLPEGDWVRAPSHLTDAECAALPCAWVTAWSALVEQGRVTAGQTVLVIGSGGVSTAAIVLARALGARVAAVTSTDARAEQLRSLGVAHTVSYRADPKWGRAIRAWSGGGVDLVVEVGGAGTLAQSLDAVRVAGTVAVIGTLAGAVEPVSVLPVLMRQIRCQGVFVGSRRAFERLVAAMEVGQLRPLVHHTWPFAALPDALASFAAGAHVGKVCLAG
jgi:NADPH:quinone reductase-like Zn-dependent oxidoreductase